MESPKILLPDGFRFKRYKTSRLESVCLEAGDEQAAPVLMIHGNTSSSLFWIPLMVELSGKYRLIAPDLRGFGRHSDMPVDAVNGVKNWTDDVIALLDVLGFQSTVIMTHSLGGIIGWDLLTRYPERISRLIQLAPGSPYGFGGTIDENGTPAFEDFAGSGAGLGNIHFAKAVSEGIRDMSLGTSSPLYLLRNVIMDGDFRSPFEENLLTSILQTRIGDDGYPGDISGSVNWPGFAPRSQGIINAVSPKYLQNLRGSIAFKQDVILPQVTWIRGTRDRLVSDESISDAAYSGALGLIKDWPGDVVFPPQPMLRQIRKWLSMYRQAGGSFEEIVIDACGHSPHIEKADVVARLLD